VGPPVSQEQNQRLLERYTNVRDLGDQISRRVSLAESGSQREVRLVRLLTQTRKLEAQLRRMYLANNPPEGTT